MVKSLLNICLDFIKSPCNSETEFDEYWLNCGMACILFKFYHYLLFHEFYYCSCRSRIFKIHFLKRNVDYKINVRARNCFHCWFIFMVEIKVKKLFKYKNNIVHFASLLGDFFSFINALKYIYCSVDFQNSEYYDSMYYSFSYYLDQYEPCLCHHPPSGPF